MKNNSSIKIIAEVGSVHDGSLGNALKMVELSSESGADIVKFQTHIADEETLRNAPMPPYFKGEPRYEYFERTGFNYHQWEKIKSHCDKHNIEFLSSPFSIKAVDLLEELNVERYKIPSGEITNIPLLVDVAKTNKQIILSTGMSTWAEIDLAIKSIKRFNEDIIVLQCTSEYPCEYENVGLNVLSEIKDRYDLPVGISDHTNTIYASLAAAVLNAKVIEKHLTFSKKMYGSDAKNSLNPIEFKDMVNGIRAIEKIMRSKIDKDLMSKKLSNMKSIFEKSIVTLVDINKNEIIKKEMIGFKKPGTGLPPSKFENVIGKKTKKRILKNSFLQIEDLQ